MLNYRVHFSFGELHQDVTFRQTTSIMDGITNTPSGLHPIEKVFMPENKQYWKVIEGRYEAIRNYLLAERHSSKRTRPVERIEKQLGQVARALADTKERAHKGFGLIDVVNLPSLQAGLVDYYWRVGDWIHEHESNTQLRDAAFKNVQAVLKELGITCAHGERSSLKESLATKSVKMLVGVIATTSMTQKLHIADQATRMFSLQMNRRYQVKASSAPAYK